MSKEKYHRGLAQAYRHKAEEVAALARAFPVGSPQNSAHGPAYSHNIDMAAYHAREAQIASLGERYRSTYSPLTPHNGTGETLRFQ